MNISRDAIISRDVIGLFGDVTMPFDDVMREGGEFEEEGSGGRKAGVTSLCRKSSMEPFRRLDVAVFSDDFKGLIYNFYGSPNQKN